MNTDEGEGEENTIEETEKGEIEVDAGHTQPKERKSSGTLKLIKRFNSFDVEDGNRSKSSQELEWRLILQLAFQSIGIVYGDIDTSPLYVFSSTFPDGIKHEDDILGVLSLMLYTIALIPVIKYVFVVLHATDNGDGGTFAPYSFICRCGKLSLIPNQQAEDQEVSSYGLSLPDGGLRRASWLKHRFENSRSAKYSLLLATMLGTSMLIGDGVLTPCISVLSAVGGIKEATASMTQGIIVWISVVILVFLFMIQRLGTEKVAYSFAPILCIWFASIGGIGIYNLFKHDPSVLQALNPQYIVEYFRRNKKHAWISLGGVVLCTTGSEALFADVGHFTVRSIQISSCAVVFPAIVFAYIGQASYLHKHKDHVLEAFYKSIPGSPYWPMFVVSVLAAIIASQSLISATFSVIHQSLALGCFPRVKVVHTSAKHEGQVYIPEINYFLMLACIGVTLGFRTTTQLGNAYGMAVVFVMTLTSTFLILIMLMIWKTNLLIIVAYALIIGGIELLYLSSVLYKFDQGGYLPLVFSMVLMIAMYVWNDVYRRKYHYELENKISTEELKERASGANISRIPRLAIFYSELAHGIPPIFKQYMANVPALHSVVVFVSIKSLHVSKVPVEERFRFRRVGPRDLNVFLCIVRYGYTDVQSEEVPFELLLVERLKQFIRDDILLLSVADSNGGSSDRGNPETDDTSTDLYQNSKEDEKQQEALDGEIMAVEVALSAGVVHLVGESEVIAGSGAGIMKRFLINYVYNILKRNLRQTDKVYDIPHKRMLKVGMTYEL